MVLDLKKSLRIKNLEAMNVDYLTSKNRRPPLNWYNRIFKEQEIEEDKRIWETRLAYGTFYLLIDHENWIEINPIQVHVVKNSQWEDPKECFVLERNTNIIASLKKKVEPFIEAKQLYISSYKFYHR
eukprot:TRINITY_DN3148_c1_g1_i1.p1 TRINITY_DN3148_c1_g1~~TRINITY_DN3148_c1_g1_i1.p1  ORF type:complete len:127 (-),score=14.56 TRINITY_DN3148_c1_g1_i1:37-417(-)